ncbi:MAG: AI-2E family transporter [Candidatus Nanopelagicales bacterium]
MSTSQTPTSQDSPEADVPHTPHQPPPVSAQVPSEVVFVPGGNKPVPDWLDSVGGWSWRLVVFTIAFGIVAWAVVQVRIVLIAVFLGFVFTAVLLPVAMHLRRWMPRPLATVLSLLAGVALILGLLTFAGVAVAGQWSGVAESVVEGLQDLLDLLRSGRLPVTATDYDIAKWAEQVGDWWSANRASIAGTAAAQFGQFAVWMMVLALAAFIAFTLLTSGDRMWQWFVRQFPPAVRVNLRKGGEVAWSAFGGYTRGAFFTACAVGVLGYVVLQILGVPLAGPLSVLVFIGSFIPLIGAPAAMLLAMIVALAANGIWNAVLVGLGIALVGQVEGNVFQPLIMAKHVKLHPVVVGVVVSAGTIVGGLVGAIVAVPLVGVGWAVFSALRPPLAPDEAPHSPVGEAVTSGAD